ncbi:UNVERIFIED_CONTAM: hypothetical protein FKN15_046706 [Acipenser sinensis]
MGQPEPLVYTAGLNHHMAIFKLLELCAMMNNLRPVNYQFQQNLDYYKTCGADLMNKTRSSAKAAPLNINKVSSSLLNFGRKLIAPAISVNPSGAVPINSDVSTAPLAVTSSSAKAAPLNINKVSSSLLNFGRKLIAPAISVNPSGAVPINSDVSTAPLAVTRSLTETSQIPQQQHHHHPQQTHHHPQQHRLLKSESMPVQLSKDVVTGGDDQVPIPAQTVTDIQGQGSRNVSSSPSAESIPVGREHSASPPLSVTKKDSLFNISRSRSHSKTMGKKESIKDILKGSLRFNQSLLEAEENEEITIADDHYCSSSHSGGGGRHGHKHMDKEAFLTVRPRQANSETSLNSEGRNSDDYILVSQEDDVEKEQLEKPDDAVCNLEDPHFPKGHKVALKPDKEALRTAVCSDPLMGASSDSSSTSGSSPEDDSSNSKDSDFTIVNPVDL